MFLLNSWSHHFAGTASLRYALSRSYSVNLPSSFSTAHPSALEYSSHPPVSVYGTGRTARFSWDPRPLFASPEGYAPRTIPSVRRELGDPSLPSLCRCRNVDLLAIGFALRLILRTGLTLIRLTLIRNPWVFGEGVFHPFYRYSYLHFLSVPFHRGSPRGFGTAPMLPYHRHAKRAGTGLRFMA